MAAIQMTRMMHFAVFAAFLVAIAQSREQEDALQIYLKEHVRALDSGRDVSAISIPVSARQAVGGAPACEDISTCLPPTVNCGSFQCSFCDRLQCLPKRKVDRSRTISEITCMRSECATAPNPDPRTIADRYCCTRNFCITNTCKPAVLPPVSLDGMAIGDVFTTEETAIRIPRVLKTDVYMLSDTTGSMAGEIDAVSKQMQSLIATLKTTTSRDLAFGLGEFRDERDFSGAGFRNVVPISLMTDETSAAAGKLEHAGGLDGPEAGLVALYKVATDPSINWRKGSRKIIVFYGDAPQHEPTCVNGKSITRADVIEKLNAKGIAIVSVSFQNRLDRSTVPFGCDKKPRPRETKPGNQAIEISKKTGGAHTLVTAREPKLAEVRAKILQAIGDSELTLERVESTCGAALGVEYIPAFPRKVKPGTTITFKQKITINPEICSFFPEECTNTFAVSGPLVAKQDISTIGMTGCVAR